MIAPARSVIVSLRLLTIVATSKIMSAVDDDCIVSPLIVVVSRSAFGSGTSSAVVIHGPIGANVSKLLPRANCPPLSRFSFCQSRALTSLPTQ